MAEVIIVRIILQLFTSRVSEGYIAEQCHLSQSTISTLINSYSDFVKSRISQIRRDMEVIWLDETFFKIARKSWALIMAVNVKGEVVGWKLSRKRTSKDISEVLAMPDAAMPTIRYLIADGARSYLSAMLRRKRDGYLIQHMHSHPCRMSGSTGTRPFRTEV